MEPARHLDAVQPRHRDVHHHDIERRVLDEPERDATVAHHVEAVPALQHGTQSFAHERVIVNEEDADKPGGSAVT